MVLRYGGTLQREAFESGYFAVACCVSVLHLQRCSKVCGYIIIVDRTLTVGLTYSNVVKPVSETMPIPVPIGP